MKLAGANTAPGEALGSTPGVILPRCWAARRAALFIPVETQVLDDTGAWCSYAADGADLSLLATGTAPLLLGHGLFFEALVGVIEVAWLDGAGLHAMARFGPTARCVEAWDMVAAGVLQHVSMGCVVAKETQPDGSARMVCWRPYEISLAVIPRNWNAKAVAPPPACFLRAARERAAMRAAGTPATWRAWAARHAGDLAAAGLADAVEAELGRLAVEAAQAVPDSIPTDVADFAAAAPPASSARPGA